MVVSESRGRERRSAGTPGTHATEGAGEPRRTSPEPVSRPREGQGLPSPPPDTVAVFRRGRRSGSSRGRDSFRSSGRGRPPARRPPKPGRGGGKWEPGTREVRRRAGEETGRAPVPPAPTPGAGARLARHPSPSPRRPQGPAGVREKTEYKSLTTASSPAPAPPSHFPPATAAAAALGMIH